MKFLSINTTTSLCSVSFFDNKKFKTLEKKDVKDHSKYLAIYTKELLKNNRNNIDFVAVSVGPGSYAGIRSSLSFVKGLCLAINKPIVPVENFDCMNEKIQYKAWKKTSILNSQHMLWAWISMIWGALTDLYIMLVSKGVITDLNTWG